ncbi:hypothetical protein C8R43DRAFT_986236 [Mycena crocata]|nr:hypothetical protein C8R43DRAFT_986236 [Mycena crocata]
MTISRGDARPRPYPWPWGQPSILTTTKEEQRRRENYWLDAELEADDSDSDYVPSDSSQGSGSSDSDWDLEDIEDSELVAICEDANSSWRYSLTPSEKEREEKEDQAQQLVDLVKAEEDAAAAYNPDEVVSLVTQLYELLITMGHWPEGSLQYPPHTTLNEALAAELGYDAAVILLMQRLPYLTPQANNDSPPYIVADRTPFADYRDERQLKEGRRPYPYQYLDDCPDLDAWMLPLTLPYRDGRHIMLDTRLGVVRAYSAEGFIPEDTPEFLRHGEVVDTDEGRIHAQFTEYRRAPLVPAAIYFSEVIYAYHSLLRLPVVDSYLSDPNEPEYQSQQPEQRRQERKEKMLLLNLYRECGWPDQWQRAEFIAKWKASEEERMALAEAARLKDRR